MIKVVQSYGSDLQSLIYQINNESVKPRIIYITQEITGVIKNTTVDLDTNYGHETYNYKYIIVYEDIGRP